MRFGYPFEEKIRRPDQPVFRRKPGRLPAFRRGRPHGGGLRPAPVFGGVRRGGRAGKNHQRRRGWLRPVCGAGSRQRAGDLVRPPGICFGAGGAGGARRGVNRPQRQQRGTARGRICILGCGRRARRKTASADLWTPNPFLEGPAAPPQYKNWNGSVVCGRLNLRLGPGAAFLDVGDLSAGDRVEILDEEVSEGEITWTAVKLWAAPPGRAGRNISGPLPQTPGRGRGFGRAGSARPAAVLPRPDPLKELDQRS